MTDERQSPEQSQRPHLQALSELFEQHNRMLVSFLVNRLGNEAEAKEVAQEAYVRMLQLHKPGAVSFLRAYLFRTAANIAVDRLRRRTRAERVEPVYESEELFDTNSPDRELIAREQLDTVRRALLELPERYRRAFLLSRFEGMRTEDICKRLGLKTTQTRLYLRRVTAYCRLRMDGLTEEEAKPRVFP